LGDRNAAATAGWLTALEVTAKNAAEWLRLAERWKRKAATIRVFGPIDAVGAPA
jgi:hypothetical protein